MPGIIGPSRGGVTTAADITRSVRRASPRGGAKNNIPAGITKISNRDKVKFLIGLGYALSEKDGWNKRAQAAWKNMMAARVQDIHPEKAAEYWSRNSKLSRDYQGKPVKTVDKQQPVVGAGAGSVDRDVSVPGAAVDPYTAAVAAGGAQTDAIFAQLGKRLKLLKPPPVTPIPLSLASRGIQPYTEDMLGDLSGRAMYESTISSLQSMLDQNARDTEANIKDIEGWYGQVGKSLATAAERDKAIQAASLASVQDAAKAIASSIGGEANPGASMAAQAGAQGAGLVQAMGAANDEFNSDIAPLIQAEGVGRMADARAEGNRRAQEIAMQLAQTRAEMSAAQGDAMLKLAQLNNELNQQRTDRELAIRQANQGLRQQDFQNKQGLYGLAASLGLAGVDSVKELLSLLPEPKTPKKPTPPSASSLRQADQAAIAAVAVLRKPVPDPSDPTKMIYPHEGDIRGGIPAALNAIQRAYGANIRTAPRALRIQMWRSAVAAMPNVKPDLLARYFSLGK